MARLVTSEGLPVPGGGRRKPRRLVAGRRLKALNSAIQGLEVLFNQDSAEQFRAAAREYTPFLVLGDEGGKVMKAWATLITALKEAKKAKA